MKKRLIVLAIAAMLMATGSAFAADMPVKAPAKAPSPVSSWSGFYLGVHVGAGWTKGNLGASYFGPGFVLDPTVASSTGRAALGGAQIGYNWMAAPAWLIGVEGDISKTNLDAFLSVAPTLGGVPVPSQPTT